MFFTPSPVQRLIADLQAERKIALSDFTKARTATDWLRNPRNLKRYNGKPDRLALERDRAAAHLARQEKRLADLDAELAKLVAVANSE